MALLDKLSKGLYSKWKQERQEALNKLPIKFAFGNKQFKEAMEELGLTENDTDKIFSVGAGGFMRKDDKQLFMDWLKSNDLEERKKDKAFFQSMIMYELGNHEYGYTYDLEETLNACNISRKDLKNNKQYAEWLEEARQEYLKIQNKWEEENGF